MRKLERKFLSVYEESKEHMATCHPKCQTNLPATTPSDDESSFEVVHPSILASNQDVQSINDYILNSDPSAGSCASGKANNLGLPQDASTDVTQTEMVTRAPNLEQVLLECKNHMEVMQQIAAGDIEQILLESKNQMEVMQTNAASMLELPLVENQMEAVRKKAMNSNKGNKVTDTERLAMVTRIAHLEKTLKKCNERIVSLEQSLRQKNAIHSQELRTQQIDQHVEQRNEQNTQHLAAAAEGPTFIEFHSLFEQEHQDKLGVMLRRLSIRERQFFKFIRWYDCHEIHLAPMNLWSCRLREVGQIFSKTVLNIEESQSANAFLRGMESDLDLYKACMRWGVPLHTRWELLQKLHGAIKQRFAEWWELNGKRITDLINIITSTSLDGLAVHSAEQMCVNSQSTETHQGNPLQTFSDVQEMGTKTPTKDDGTTDPGFTDHDLRQQIAQLFKTTREET
ncbi:hypothetical protein DFS34DRAFT_651123 [Phlyctochytrium arcticum]|nr:hypothetical protein DFS34DRAFT_651123 [Phlyctochytrium arcticum]